MLKTKTIFEIKKGERDYIFVLSPESPLGECLDVVNEIRAFIINRINESAQEVTQTDALEEKSNV